MAVSAVKFAMSEVEVADLATSATFLRPRTLPLTKPLTQCGPGERAMRAAYGYLVVQIMLHAKCAARGHLCTTMCANWWAKASHDRTPLAPRAACAVSRRIRLAARLPTGPAMLAPVVAGGTELGPHIGTGLRWEVARWDLTL